ncbi:MAG: hypothetical protein HRU27_02115 [Rhizobiaceae bacterium]|nr:hypothetical protein [Hyphomicrobiales bacterium]NRB29373.1 hypothetical protein [Rhizobiaceae bacterium]
MAETPSAPLQQFDQVELRPPSMVMRLERAGSFFPTRLSFLRSLLRRLARDGMQLTRPIFDLDENGYGQVVYDVVLDGQHYSLICYSQALAPENRTDRVIAEAWDACFILFDGQPTKDDIEHLKAHATVQEAGEYDERVLVLSRANKSVRLFEHVASRLATGQQPSAEMIGKIGYLMRTTAVYGNGKFGMADRADFIDRPSLSQPFRLEMLTVYLIREFTLDLINHVARAAGGDAACELDDRFRRQLGIGNSTGLGMAPFLVGHPVLINNWMLVRETALARVRAIHKASKAEAEHFLRLLEQTRDHLQEWQVDDEYEMARIEALRSEFKKLAPKFQKLIHQEYPYDEIIVASQDHSSSLQELMVSLVLEPNGDVVDGLCECMEDTFGPKLDPLMTVEYLQELLTRHYAWTRKIDLSDSRESAMVWYVSEEKLEPRMGERSDAHEERHEMPHAIPRKVQALMADLDTYASDALIAEVLMAHPQHRDITRRVQTIARHPYGEFQDNLVAADIRPIDLLRCKLSFFGASKFDPRSDRWTRITLYQGAPTARELTLENCADVFLPAFGSA